MNRFALARPQTTEQASGLATDQRFSLPVLKSGGIDVLDLVKEGVLEPDLLIEVRPLSRSAGTEPVSWADGSAHKMRLRLEAGATLTDLAGSELLGKRVPALRQTAASAATPQIRNVATVAGNLLQRPRCWYFRNITFDCLKKGGSRCFAADGENKFHAIFGPGPCHIVHPSNLAVVLSVTGATIHLTGGTRDGLAIADLYHMPDKGILTEHNLEPGEIVTHVTLDPAPHSGFYAIKEKQSFDWPLVMAGVNLDLDPGTRRIRGAKVCAGAVAPVPWMLPDVADALAGVSIDDDKSLLAAAARSTNGAAPMTDNSYKLTLLPVAVYRATLIAAGRTPEDLT